MQPSCINPGGRTAKSPSANPAAEYQRRSAQVDSVFDIDRPARIFHTTGARSGRGIREAAESRLLHCCSLPELDDQPGDEVQK